MSIRNWYVSARAVREYAAIAGRPAESDEAFGARARELEAMAAGAHHLRDQRNGLQIWRTGRPLRLRLVVSPEARPEGPLPQVVSVLPAHERGMTR
jgi:hypothetical protein